MKRLLCLLLLASMFFSCDVAIAWTAQEYYHDISELPEKLSSILPEDIHFINGLRHANTTYIFTSVGQETWQVFIYRREPEGYVLDCQSSYLSVWRGATPHIGCSGPDALHLMYDGIGMSFGFGRLDDGKWVLRSIQGQDVFSMDLAKKEVKCHIDKNGKTGTLRGTFEEILLSTLDMEQVPFTFEEAFPLVNAEGYAIVKESLNKGAPLHKEPTIDSALTGTYFTGTPVDILEDRDEWVHVSVLGVTGYMMKSYLAFDTDMAQVQPYFLPRSLKSENLQWGINVYLEPDTNSYVVGELVKGDDSMFRVFIIGEKDNEWYHILRNDNLSGYVQEEFFWDGNG
jgi:SH3-like domain-containing protein